MATQPASVSNPLKSLIVFGQSVWLDYIRRNLITSGELYRLIGEDGLRGMTSNPAIFEKAITGSTDYQDAIAQLARETQDPVIVYERLAVRDIRDAADVLRPVYDETRQRDGYVSLEVSPRLAHDTQGTLAEARRLWAAVDRPNVMIKVPGTPEGVPAIEALIAEGINVNVTLLFAQSAYERVAEAFIAGLERRAAAGAPLHHLASVASFFVSRIDTLIDTRIEERLKRTDDPKEQGRLRSVQGKVAIANAKLTYRRYGEIFSGPRWQALAQRGAQTQRLLWASTSTKNPAYRDVLYVEELIGPDTVNTMPPATFDAFRDHGTARLSLTTGLEEALQVMETLEQVGLSMREVTDTLLVDAVRLFVEPFEKLIAAVAKQISTPLPARINRQSMSLPESLARAVAGVIGDWRAGDKARRLWARDATLWTGADESQWLGWLGLTEEECDGLPKIVALADEVRREGFTHVLLLGMGGSSLCPEVMARTFGRRPGFPELHVLDSTDPAQVAAAERRIDLARTLFIVSSKSGGTLEPNVFKQYFFERVREIVGDTAGSHFIAITDPGSKMQQVAEADRFRHICFGVPSVGGRYSALSAFGLVPAAVMGVDVAMLLDRADEMVEACAATVPVSENPGVVLGGVLGAAHALGRDKLTIVASPAVASLGGWLEQLVAESTGKSDKAIVPVDREALGPPEVYGADRLFVYLRLETGPDASQDKAIETLERAGQPVMRIAVDDVYDLGEEFFRWEFATAVAGSVMGIHPFDQPDVEASKVATRRITSEYEQTGTLPPETPVFEGDDVKIFTDGGNASALAPVVGTSASLVSWLRAHVNRLRDGDYFALLAYIEMNEAHDACMQAIRHAVRDRRRVATCVGFGPRFLHSTGQAYKGGSNTGVFLQITCDDAVDLPVPGQRFTFGVVKAAQARGDFQVLVERGRRALRVHLGPDVRAGLAQLESAMREALG